MSIINDRLGNASWQLKVLRGLSNIADNIEKADNDYEAKTVRVTSCSSTALNGLYLEIRIFDAITGVFSPPVYYKSGSNTPVLLPAPCAIEYLSDAATLALILAELESIDIEIKGNPNKTPSLNREVADGTILAGAFSVTFANVGTAAAGIGGDNTIPVVAGTVLEPGETVTFSGSGKDTLAAIDYQADATAILLIAEVR
jgi:hypothetical protein